MPPAQPSGRPARASTWASASKVSPRSSRKSVGSTMLDRLADQPLGLIQTSVVGRSHGRDVAPLALGGDVVRGARLLGQCYRGLHLVASAEEIERLGLHGRQRRQDPRFANIAEDGNAQRQARVRRPRISSARNSTHPQERARPPRLTTQSTLLEVVARFPEEAARLVEAPLHRDERGLDWEAWSGRTSVGRRQSQAALHGLRDRHGTVSQRIPDLKDRKGPQPRILARLHEIQRMFQLRAGCPSSGTG